VLRLFVGLGIPYTLRLQLTAMNGGIPGARWVAAENLHLSLRFIGEVDEDTAEDIDAALGQIFAEPVAVALAGVGCFEKRGRANTVWAGAKASPALLRLQARVEAALQQAGLPPVGRKFTPHVTLARMQRLAVQNIAPYLSSHGGFRTEAFTVREFSLFRVYLGRKSADYEFLENYELLP